MAVGFGVDPTTTGGVLKGTTSQDIRKVVEGMFSNQGILRGCTVTTRSDLKYNVSLGSVVCEISEGESVIVPVYAGTVTTPAPSVDRQDYICVKQNLPQIDGNSDVVLLVRHTAPTLYERAMVLAQYTAKAGKTRTSDFVETAGFYRNYAVPTASAGKYLFKKTETFNGLIKPKKDLPFMKGNFYLETDRLIEFVINTTVDSDVGAGISDAMYAEIFIDGTKKVTFSTGKIDTSWSQTHTFVWNTALEKGSHTIQVRFNELADSGLIRVRYVPGGFPGSSVTVKDLGVND